MHIGLVAGILSTSGSQFQTPGIHSFAWSQIFCLCSKLAIKPFHQNDAHCVQIELFGHLSSFFKLLEVQNCFQFTCCEKASIQRAKISIVINSFKSLKSKATFHAAIYRFTSGQRLETFKLNDLISDASSLRLIFPNENLRQ